MLRSLHLLVLSLFSSSELLSATFLDNRTSYFSTYFILVWTHLYTTTALRLYYFVSWMDMFSVSILAAVSSLTTWKEEFFKQVFIWSLGMHHPPISLFFYFSGQVFLVSASISPRLSQIHLHLVSANPAIPQLHISGSESHISKYILDNSIRRTSKSIRPTMNSQSSFHMQSPSLFCQF